MCGRASGSSSKSTTASTTTTLAEIAESLLANTVIEDWTVSREAW